MARYYQSPIGTLRLISIGGKWYVTFKGEHRGPFASSQLAADAVYHHNIGCPTWDRYKDLSGLTPMNAADWEEEAD